MDNDKAMLKIQLLTSATEQLRAQYDAIENTKCFADLKFRFENKLSKQMVFDFSTTSFSTCSNVPEPKGQYVCLGVVGQLDQIDDMPIFSYGEYEIPYEKAVYRVLNFPQYMQCAAICLFDVNKNAPNFLTTLYLFQCLVQLF